MSDLISRQAAIDALAKAMPSLTTPDGYGEFDHDIQIADEAFVDSMQIIHGLPSADVPHWIPCSERMPETSDEVLTTYIVNGNTKKRYIETATWWADNSDEGGCWTSVYDEYRKLGTRIERIAWLPKPEPYKEGEQNGTD